ncbi:DUF551 domain-containing protein [Enterobacter hormaechei]|uniref:DUF551 domain-containing protein n=1 Tax=Enterobacter hormaechei TaxID=158836 RepID=UPI0012F9E739|nr:DUF551 domain-containing protein [Enterobacter hormaechei]QGU36166.1 DUF551 domain-containing protein [Enterobacter hormaechei]
MGIITTERLTKILSETQAVISECNARGVHGSVEVNARLFENVLMELLRHRAAMLQGAEPVSNRDELPNGWVACSERMPSNGERDIWLLDGEFVHHGYIWNGDDFVDWNEEYASIKGITHWMKMALPAAPQQEVK